MISLGPTTLLLAILLAGASPAAAQPANPDPCTAAIDLAWLKSDGVDKDAPPTQAFIDQAMQQPLIQIFCVPAGETTDGQQPNPARSEPPAAAPPAAVAPPADDGPDARVDTDRSACILVTVAEVGVAMQQAVTASPADPFGVPGAVGCEFDGDGTAFTSLIYFPANGPNTYESFHNTAEANGVQAVAGLGDRAFSFVGGNGPGLVVAKGDKLFAVEFNGLGSGPAEERSLLVLAQQAAGRVH
jgi:hypothetical protein